MVPQHASCHTISKEKGDKKEQVRLGKSEHKIGWRNCEKKWREGTEQQEGTEGLSDCTTVGYQSKTIEVME